MLWDLFHTLAQAFRHEHQAYAQPIKVSSSVNLQAGGNIRAPAAPYSRGRADGLPALLVRL